jgi:hypothetical protein
MDMNSLIEAVTALNLGLPDRTDAEETALTRGTQVNTSLIVRLPISISDTTAAALSLAKTSLPPQASLLGLPQELKDQIYEYLTEDEDRIILGWRFVEAYKRRYYPALSHEECFTSAIALHPLSMTCKQMLHEFQPVHLRATKLRWTFLVNNFDLEQLMLLSGYINNELLAKSIIPSNIMEWYDAIRACKPLPFTSHVDFTLRFQMDNNAVGSADKLRDIFWSSCLDDCRAIEAFEWVEYANHEVATLYSPRTGGSAKHVRSMTKAEAKRIEFTFRDLYCTVELAERRTKQQIGIHYRDRGECLIEVAWFQPFSEAVKDMGLGKEVRGHY